MRFIPATHMGVGDICVQVNTNGGVSGSFTSGSETWMYHEYTSSARLSDTSFSFELTSGYTQNARVILVGGGGGGGSAACTYAAGGGGGGGAVEVYNDVNMFAGLLYTVRVGGAGDGGDPCDITPTYDGDDGNPSRFFVGGSDFDLRAEGGKGGNGNSLGTLNCDGGDSGNGFSGGNDAGTNLGGGGAGATANGQNANGATTEAGDGGAGIAVPLPYTSPTLGVSAVRAGGGGGGGNSIDGDFGAGATFFGGGSGAGNGVRGADKGTRHTGGGGGGGNDGNDKPDGGDGFIIIMYPTGSCS